MATRVESMGARGGSPSPRDPQKRKEKKKRERKGKRKIKRRGEKKRREISTGLYEAL